MRDHGPPHQRANAGCLIGTRRFVGREEGSALVLVVLLTLILSATAIVALRDVARTTRASAVYRTNSQARTTSDNADRLFVALAGQRAPALVHAMQEGSFGGDTDNAGTLDDAGVYGINADDGGAGWDLEQKRRALAIRGTDIEFSPEQLSTSCGSNCDPLLPDYGGTESGLFSFGGNSTFESRRTTEWRVRVRDLVDGFPAEGFSGNYCFKKALIVSEAVVGDRDPEWTRANNIAMSRHGIDAMLGPVECGYN